MILIVLLFFLFECSHTQKISILLFLWLVHSKGISLHLCAFGILFNSIHYCYLASLLQQVYLSFHKLVECHVSFSSSFFCHLLLMDFCSCISVTVVFGINPVKYLNPTITPFPYFTLCSTPFHPLHAAQHLYLRSPQSFFFFFFVPPPLVMYHTGP